MSNENETQEIKKSQRTKQLFSMALQAKEDIRKAEKELSEKKSHLVNIERELEEMYPILYTPFYWNGYIVRTPNYKRAGYNGRGIVFDPINEI